MYSTLRLWMKYKSNSSRDITVIINMSKLTQAFSVQSHTTLHTHVNTWFWNSTKIIYTLNCHPESECPEDVMLKYLVLHFPWGIFYWVLSCLQAGSNIGNTTFQFDLIYLQYGLRRLWNIGKKVKAADTMGLKQSFWDA